jgi:hypothetical protein
MRKQFIIFYNHADGVDRMSSAANKRGVGVLHVLNDLLNYVSCVM